MLVLASARDLILLFVAFELMSIPLYAMAGFQKRDSEAVEAALKFFLVGTVSSALIAYGLSFVYGVTRTTLISGIGPALAGGSPLLVLGLVITLAGLGFKIAAFPFHMDAVIATGGKQYRVTPGQVIKVERLGKSQGESVEFNQVLLVNQDGKVTVEPQALKSAKVTGEVVVEKQGAKVLVVKFKRRKNYRRHRGHRQIMTAVRITQIEV